jgi:hypothetical protein
MKKSTALLFACGTVVLFILTGLAMSYHSALWASVTFFASLVVMGIGFSRKA